MGHVTISLVAFDSGRCSGFFGGEIFKNIMFQCMEGGAVVFVRRRHYRIEDRHVELSGNH